MAERKGISSILSRVKPAGEADKKPSNFDRLMKISPLDVEPNLATIAKQVSERSTGDVHRNGPPETSTGTGVRNRTPDEIVHRNRTPKPDDGVVHRNGPPERSTGTIVRNDQTMRTNEARCLLQEKPVIKTDKQRKLLAFLSANPSITATHAYISEARGQRKNTVRDNLNLFEAHGLITKKTVRIPGSGVALEILFRSTVTVHRNGPPETSTGTVHRTSPLKIDREDLNLSISQEDMAIQWPNLVRCGFGPEQLTQIERSLSRVGKPTDRIVQGLDHLEYALANDQLRDKAGQPVADPCSWAFRALAQNGYYRRPKGYASPEEQAAKDAEAEAKAIVAARQAAEQAQFETWRDGLSAEELSVVMRGHPGGSKEAWLKKTWRERFRADLASHSCPVATRPGG